MKLTDIRIKEIHIVFSDEKFRTPLRLSTGNIETITYVGVSIAAENRAGAVGQGIGAIFLSDLWAFPSSSVSHGEKDRLMRRCVSLFETALVRMGGFADPLQIAVRAEEALPRMLRELQADSGIEDEIPKLAGLVCWSPFDAAIHDAWSKAAGKSAYDMYSAAFLNEDLSGYLGPGWEGIYPDAYIKPPRRNLRVQHAVGLSDPLTDGEVSVAGLQADGLPVSLTDWIGREQVNHFKLKLKGSDPAWDLQRIIDVFRVSADKLSSMGVKEPVCLALDPNEGCSEAPQAVELLRKLRETNLPAYEAVAYLEQPVHRNIAAYNIDLREVSRYKPLLVDEGLDDHRLLPDYRRLGWNGVALKTCKGQSNALIAYCWARRNNMFVTVQDLTNPGYALIQSANLCSHLAVSWDLFEYNARQYAPFSRMADRALYPELFKVDRGCISLSQMQHLGLY